MRRFVLLSILLSFLIGGGVWTGANQGWFSLPPAYLKIVVFLAVSTIGMYGLISRRIGVSPRDFVKIYIGATVLRILFFGTFIFLVILADRGAAWKNAFVFLVSYFLFTSLEVTALFRKVDLQKPPQDGQKDP